MSSGDLVLQNIFQYFLKEVTVQIVAKLVEMGHIPDKNILANLGGIAHILCLFIEQRALYRIDKGAVFTTFTEILCQLVKASSCGIPSGHTHGLQAHAYCRTSTLANTDFKLPQDFWFWAPTIRHADPNVKDCIAKFKALTESKQYISETHPRLFFLWGHSWEFKKFDNWELLEEICRELSGMEDTWYATNMEIYEYTQAYNSLVYSADSLRVYNPTRTDVWFFRDRVTYCVKAGETITLPPPAPVCK